MLSAFIQRIIPFLDWYLPPELLKASRLRERQKARVVVGVSIVGFFFTTSIVILNSVLPSSFVYSVYLIIFVCLFIPLGLKFFSVNLESVTSPAAFMLSTALLIGIRSHGVSFSGLASWIPVYIMLTFILCNVKWGIVISIYLITGNVLLYFQFLSKGIHQPANWDRDVWLNVLINDQVSAAVFAVILVVYFIHTIREAEVELEGSKDTIIAQQETLFKNSRMTELGELSGGVAHEINNPLAIILAANQRLKREIDSDKIDIEQIKNLCDKIDKTGHRISKIISGLKSYSRDGKDDPIEPIKLSKIFEDIAEIFQEKFKVAEVEFEIKSEYNETLFLGRYVQVYQILVNLIANSFDAIEDMDDKKICIDVQKEDGRYLNISVIDSGAGIAVDIEDKIFNPFFTTKPVGKGTGLGLSIVAGIMTDHKGDIFVNREFGDARITVKFPLAHTQPVLVGKSS